ncbi:MAG: Stp1/IreP family PP2C-type Ser/Thr phosphatase [Gaiellaceae bacterium]
MSTLRHGSATDAGRKRRRNEDAHVVEPPLFAVADGMGGAQAGELASELAAAAVKDETGAGHSGEERVLDVIQEANRRVYQRSSEDAAASGMGTTMTVALVEDSRVFIGHVGDSRAYLIRAGRLEQLTEDHSLVAELVRSGKLSPEEAETHPQRSVITRALGTDPDVDVDMFSIETAPGDLFMLCSDGLTSMVDDEAILGEIERHRNDLRAAAKSLVRAANRRGGEDNITVVLFEIASNGALLEATAQMPAVEEPAEDADEDTLDERDGVPAVDTMVLSAEEAARLRGQVAPKRKRRRWKRVAIGLLVLVALLVVAALVVWGLRA